MLSGITLKDAANADNVSVETKRSQTTSLMSKAKVNRQQDILLTLLPELIRLLQPDNWNKEGEQIFNTYVKRYLPADVRCQKLLSVDGSSIRIISFGPVRGKPLLALHPMIFPEITVEDVEFAYRHNIKMAWSLRPGLLTSTQTPMEVKRYSEETIQGIELAWQHFCGEPTPLLAMVSSAWHPASFSKMFPEKVSTIFFSATCFSAGKYENSLIYFDSSIAELCSRNVWLMVKTVDFIRKT